MDKITKALDIARKERAGENSHVQLRRNESIAEDKITNGNTSISVPVFTPNALTLEKNRILNSASREEIVQPYKVLRTRLMHIMQENNWASIAILSPTKDDGKTTVAINLSISIGNSQNNNAVLLDLDLLTPCIGSCYGYQPQYGLEDYFNNNQPLSDIIMSPDIEGLIVAPSVKPLRNSSEYLSTVKSKVLVDEAQSLIGNSIVIVDLPPVLVSDDAISFLPHIDAALLVVREGKTNKQELERTLEMLTNVNIAGVVMNDSLEPATLGYY